MSSNLSNDQHQQQKKRKKPKPTSGLEEKPKEENQKPVLEKQGLKIKKDVGIIKKYELQQKSVKKLQ
jgi:hypothetical protein